MPERCCKHPPAWQRKGKFRCDLILSHPQKTANLFLRFRISEVAARRHAVWALRRAPRKKPRCGNTGAQPHIHLSSLHSMIPANTRLDGA